MNQTIPERLGALAVALLVLSVTATAGAQPGEGTQDDDNRARLAFVGTGHTFHGGWSANVRVSSGSWTGDMSVWARVGLRFEGTHIASLAAAGIKADKLCVLVTAERSFDADGWMRLASDERMSTLLTPTGLAIEGGVQGAMTTRYGYPFKAPFDQLVTLPVANASNEADGTRVAVFPVQARLPKALPPGLYRLRFDFGVMVGSRVYNLNGYTFASRPFSDQVGTSTYFYSPVIPASGTHVSGRFVDAEQIRARCPWLLLYTYNSNGYKGVVADEDAGRFATSDRSLIPDEVILPMYDGGGTTRLSYSLEPKFPVDTIDSAQNIRWNWASGEWSARVAGPDGSVVDLGTSRFVAQGSNGPTTKNSAMTAWKPQAYGRYTVTATGWIEDASGRRYEGGGTYRFWIAKRMTLATATFQGMPYPVGSTYGRDIQFNPAFPADVQVTAKLLVNSDTANVRSLTYSGKASTAGLFGAAQGMKSFPLDAPGEYHAHVLATHVDGEGHLWVSTMRHAGIVYPEPSKVTARGKRLSVGGKYVERGERKFEGYIEPDGTQHLDHITFPYNGGDVLLIGAEGQGANKIEPVLVAQVEGETPPTDASVSGVGTTNLRIRTSNGYSPHLYPEYITDIEYYYAAAPRPGFMGRFIVGESIVRAPYWPVSPNSFGGQIGASANGDAPGDIYRLLGGVVLRRAGQTPMYAGYIASAFLLPKGTNNNRVVAAGSEDLHGPLGDKARFFLVGLRPGTAYELGATFRPAVQIDPLLPVAIRFELTYPDGRQQVATGTGDRFGSFAGGASWPLDVPGVYRYRLQGNWSGFTGRMPGLPESGGEFYVYSKTRPAGSAGLRLDGATQRTFSATTGVTITGSSTASRVHFSLLTPGAVIDVGDVPVSGGRFQYTFDPAAVHARVPLYDIVSITTGKPQIGRVIHLTFFSEERSAGGTFFDVVRVILRGTTALSARAMIPAATGAGLGAVAGAGTTGAPPVMIAIDDTNTQALRSWDSQVDWLARDGDLVLVDRREDPWLRGRVHERFQQLHQGVPVIGGQVTRQLDGGVAVSIFGSLFTGLSLETWPEVTLQAATDTIRTAADSGGGRPRPPTLAVLPIDAVGFRLAWRGEATFDGQESLVTFIDATTSDVLLQYRLPQASRGRTLDLAGHGESGVLADAFRRLMSGLDAASGVQPERAATEAGGVAVEALRLAMAYPPGNASGFAAAAAAREHRAGVERAAMRAFEYLLPSGGNFATARAVTIQSARELFGEDSTVARALADAWTAVGIR